MFRIFFENCSFDKRQKRVINRTNGCLIFLFCDGGLNLETSPPYLLYKYAKLLFIILYTYRLCCVYIFYLSLIFFAHTLVHNLIRIVNC